MKYNTVKRSDSTTVHFAIASFPICGASTARSYQKTDSPVTCQKCMAEAAAEQLRLTKTAVAARKALEALRKETGPQPWIERAIISCDAVSAGFKTDSAGRPLDKQTAQAKTWKELGL